MAGHTATARFFVKRLTAFGLVAADLLFTGCTKMVSFVGVSHYSYPVNFYLDESNSGQFALLASNIPAESLFGANMRYTPDGSVYRFSVRNLQGKVVDVPWTVGFFQPRVSTRGFSGGLFPRLP